MQFLSKTFENNIKKDIASSITRSCNNARLNCRRRPQEPDYIAYLLRHLPRSLYDSLQSYSAQYDFGVMGVFCHQKPIVQYGGVGAELGDLMFAYIEEDAGIRRCNSLLLQAKLVEHIPYTIPGRDDHQLKLYTDWPRYTYKGHLNGKSRDILPKAINNGAQYLMMKRPCTDEKDFICAYANKTLYNGTGLADSLIGLLNFSTGRTFDPEYESKDDWSNMIWDLLNIARSSKFRRINSKAVNEDRLYGPYGLDVAEHLFAGVDYPDRNSDNSELFGAIPTVLIYAKRKSSLYDSPFEEVF